MACNEVCEKKRERMIKGDTWWWNEEMKEAVSRKKERSTHKMCLDSTEENKRRYDSLKKQSKESRFKSNELEGFGGAC